MKWIYIASLKHFSSFNFYIQVQIKNTRTSPCDQNFTKSNVDPSFAKLHWWYIEISRYLLRLSKQYIGRLGTTLSTWYRFHQLLRIFCAWFITSTSSFQLESYSGGWGGVSVSQCFNFVRKALYLSKTLSNYSISKQNLWSEFTRLTRRITHTRPTEACLLIKPDR